MSPSNLLYLYRRRLRARFVQELLALAGIAAGVALLFAVQVSNTSLNASIGQLTDGLLGDAQVQLVARDPHGFDERLVGAVARDPDVRAVAPVLLVQANAVGSAGEHPLMLIGADARLTRMNGELLREFASEQLEGLEAAVLPAAMARTLGVGFGQRVLVQIDGRAIRVPVGAIVDRNEVGPLADTPAIVVPLRFAQRLAGLDGRVTRLLVVPVAGREEAVEAMLRERAGGRVDVRPRDFDSRVFAQAAAPNDQSSSLFAAISALVGFLFAFNAMLLMTRERRRVIAELRMSGFSIPVVVKVLLLDALVLGVCASVVGVLLGDQLSRHLFQPAPGYLTLAFPVGTGRIVQGEAVALALASGVLAVLLATLSPLFGLFSGRPIDAIDDDRLDESEPRRFLRSRWLVAGGLVCLLAVGAILLWAPHAAMLGIVLLTASMLLTLPAILRVALGTANHLRRRTRSVVPVIAIGEVESSGIRSVGLAALAAIAVFGSTAVGAAQQDLQQGLDRLARELSVDGELWVSPAGDANALATTPFRPERIGAVAGLPEVAAVRLYRGGFLDVGDRRAWVLAPPRDAGAVAPRGVDGEYRRAVRQVRRPGDAVVSEAIASQLGLRVGESFTLRAPTPTRFRLAGVTSNLGWTPGAIVVNADDYRSAWGSDDVSALLVDLADGTSQAAGARAVRRALGSPSGLVVETARNREARHQETARQGLSRLTQIATLVLIAASLAMAAAMGGMIWQRRRRLADLKLAGIGHRRLWRAMLLESALLLTIGCTAGAVYGLFGQQLLDRWLRAATGFPVAESIGLLVALMCLAVVTLVALVIAMLPGYLAARVPTDIAFQD
jgi:putative ABC transport system permease protein